MSAIDNLGQITEETIEAVRKAQTSGISVATGIQGVDLSGVVSLVPVNTPFFERVKRTDGKGAESAQWKALLNINNAQPNPFVGLEAGGNFVQFSERNCLAPYQPVRLSGKVTRDAIDQSRDYADAKALAVTGTLMQWRIQENKALLGANAVPLPTVSAPTVTFSAGGTIPTTTAVHVKCAARSGFNYYWGGSGAASADGTATTASAAQKATATVPAVQGAVAYDWFVGPTTGTYFYYTTTVTNTVTFTAIPVANAGSVPSLPSLSSTVPAAVPTQDNSFPKDGSSNPTAYNGLITSITADYGTNGLVTAGSGAASGATIVSLDGATLTSGGQGIVEIDALLLDIYNTAQLSPSALLMGGTLASKVKELVFGSDAASTFLDPQGNGRVGATAGGSVARYVNGAAGGEVVDIVVDPHFFPGQIAAITERIPYPNSGIANTFEARCQRDVAQFDYGVSLTAGAAGSGPREEWDVSSLETFINRAPVACGLLTNIG